MDIVGLGIKIVEQLVEAGYDVHRSSGIDYTVLGAVGVPHTPVDPRVFEVLRRNVESLEAGALPRGQFRPLRAEEVLALRRSVRLG